MYVRVVLCVAVQQGELPDRTLARRRITVNGVHYSACVSMHASENGKSSASYDIEGFFSELSFAVGLNDDVEFSLSDVVFEVRS